ncbi:MAG TPA: NAD-dependent epimerase/dehydratase family protein [Chloroflexota bacterium]|nr:NAD-dependent epimerase/dehydratase family protein [Chloroflexota bacterium]
MENTRSIVTGAAGFIGSHLAERLIALGHDVVGIDSFTPYYDPTIKRANVAGLLNSPRFQLIEANLATADLEPIVAGADYVFHQAAQAGVRASWGSSFSGYTEYNVLATQRLLEALKEHRPRKVVYASSSSVYGDAALPMRETARPQPVSPYGVTKLAAEHLCHLYRVNHGLPTVSLRYFTVYGPRQRPDMGIHKFIHAILSGKSITVYGDGRQSRDFTYVTDIVEANILAALTPTEETVFNIGGGTRITVRDLLALIERISGRRANVVHAGTQHGDVGHTASDSQRARTQLNFAPSVDLAEGLYRQVVWHRQTLGDELALAG